MQSTDTDSRPTEVAHSPAGRQRRFGLFQKLVAIVVLTNLPVLLLGSWFVSEYRKDTLTAEKERQGIAYLTGVWPVFDASIRRSDPTRSLSRVADAGARFDKVMRTGIYHMSFVDETEQGGSRAVDAGHDFIMRIADNSGLTVDPDLSTLQAINIVSTRIPDVAQAAYHLVYGSGDDGDAMEESGLDRFRRSSTQLMASLSATDALNFEPNLARRLTAAYIDLNTATDHFSATANAMASGDSGADQHALIASHVAFQTALSVYWTTAVEALDLLLATRITYLQQTLLRDLALAGTVLAVVLCLVWLMSRSITGRLGRLGDAMDSMRRGQLNVSVPHASGRDEVGEMARAVENFRKGLLEKRRVDQALLQHQAELQTQNLRFDSALRHMSQGLAMFDRNSRLIVSNAHFAEVYGLNETYTAPATSSAEIMLYLLEKGTFADSVADRIRAGDSPLGMSGQARDALLEMRDGRMIFVSQRAMPEGGWVSTHEDITERRQAEARIAYMAHHDELTGLANRALFKESIAEAATIAAEGNWAAVLCLDIDNFKGVNDTLGHPVGDALLKIIAERLDDTVSARGTVARLGGDEFGIVMPGLTHPDDAGAFAQTLVGALSEPYEVDGHEVIIGASIGIAIAPTDGIDADQLLKNADIGLYRAKDDGRGTHRFFERAMDARLQARRALELDLHRALATDQFIVHYQPQVNLAECAVRGFEALIRWQHPEGGLVRPDEFIPLAEKSGLILPLGRLVLNRACRDAASWPDGIKVAVNLSPTQFRDRNLVATVVGALSSSGLAPFRLELEITESVLLQDNEATLATLHQLRALGVRIAMDDFGTGYSSLSYLRSFPFDKIKIDRSFTHDLEDKSDGAAIVRAVAGLGASLGITTTAEGVETRAQLEIVRNEGCTEVQGYVFSPPLDAAGVRRFLVRFRRDMAEVA